MPKVQRLGGVIPMDGALLDTLNLLRRVKGADSFEVLDKLGAKVSVTAINNRLEELRKLSLVKRERRGRRWFYTVV